MIHTLGASRKRRVIGGGNPPSVFSICQFENPETAFQMWFFFVTVVSALNHNHTTPH